MDEPLGAMVNQVLQFGPPAGVPHVSQSSEMIEARASRAQWLWSAVNRSPGWTLAALIAFYLAIACGQAATKLLWCDELITLAIARQGSMAGIWRALAAGADPNPPLSHWLTLEATRAFGRSALAVRLPAVLCVLLAIVCVWAILRRWVCPGYAAVGVLALMATRGFDYAYDARSYAPLMGFAMASLALWLVSAERRGGIRFAALAGMAAALALGVSSNYYGVLAFFPIAAGEAARMLSAGQVARRFQPGAWVAMALAATPLLAFLPLIRHNLTEFAPHAWNRPSAGMVVESYLVLVEGVFWPVLGLAMVVVWKRRESGHPTKSQSSGSALKRYEATALGVLLLYPILGFAVALCGGGMISARCVAPVCCGFGIAAALLGRRVFGKNTQAGVVLLSVALLWVAVRESACAIVLSQQRVAFFELRDRVASQPGDRPIVVGDSLFVLPLAHYSGEDVRARTVFPIDFDAIHRFEPDDSLEQNLWAGRNGIFPVRIVPYNSPPLEGQELTVIARPGGWLARRLASDGFLLDGSAPDPAWQRLGGVFTPMAHDGTGLLLARNPPR
jgi:hypothetical protein